MEHCLLIILLVKDSCLKLLLLFTFSDLVAVPCRHTPPLPYLGPATVAQAKMNYKPMRKQKLLIIIATLTQKSESSYTLHLICSNSDFNDCISCRYNECWMTHSCTSNYYTFGGPLAMGCLYGFLIRTCTERCVFFCTGIVKS